MSYANGTTHYNLPLTTGSDKRDWADTNQAFTDVDAALYGAVQDTAQAELDIDALETRMDTAEQNIGTNTTNIAGLDTRLTTAEGAITSQASQIADVKQDTEDMICAYNEASATSTHAYAIGDYFIYNDVLYKATKVIAIGDTIVPDTNCATTNVTTELLASVDLSDDVQQLQTDVGNIQTDVGNLQTAVDNITVGYPDRVLWENPSSPLSSFAAQTVAIDLTGVKLIGIAYAVKTDPVYIDVRIINIVPVDGNSYETFAHYYSGGTGYEGQRRVTASASGVTFGNADSMNLITPGAPTMNNTYCIPAKIIKIL